jgi:hypothetical protein
MPLIGFLRIYEKRNEDHVTPLWFGLLAKFVAISCSNDLFSPIAERSFGTGSPTSDSPVNTSISEQTAPMFNKGDHAYPAEALHSPDSFIDIPGFNSSLTKAIYPTFRKGSFADVETGVRHLI